MRSHRISRLVVVWALAAAAACSSKVGPETTPAPTTRPAAEAGGARIITLEALEASLASLKPSTVAFDIDDTALYTGLAFLFAQGYLEERDAGRFRDDRRFWTLINDSLDARFSKPKRIARELIAFHQQRGDTIVFVTSRFPSEPASDRTRRLLQRLFAFPAPPTVLFTAQAPKTGAIRAVRIIRSPVSYNERPFQPGKYGEEILANSAD